MPSMVSVSAAESLVTASPATVASGEEAAVGIVANDASGDPIAGVGAEVIAIACTGTNNTLTQPSGVTSSAGSVGGGAVSSTTAEAKTVSVMVAGIAITDTAALTVEGTVTALFEEDWDYADTAAMEASFSDLYTETAVSPYVTGTGSYALETGTGFGGENYMEVTFPDVTSWTGTVVFGGPGADRLQNYTMRPEIQLDLTGSAFEFFMRFRFSANWTTLIPDAWNGGTQNADHKTMLLYGLSDVDRWSVKIGAGESVFGPVVRVGDVVSADRDCNQFSWVAGDPEVLGTTYWDNQWHTMTLRISGIGGVSGQTDTLLDGILVDSVTGRDYSSYTGLDFLNPGANRNQGQSETMLFDVGLIRITSYTP